MVMSVAGIVFDGYFFAFHLLNIVNNNQLLRGVIQAVTQNGLYWSLVSSSIGVDHTRVQGSGRGAELASRPNK